jgi:hypothetical protein
MCPIERSWARLMNKWTSTQEEAADKELEGI